MDLKYVNNEFKNLLTEMATFSLELKNQFSTLEKSLQKRFITSYLTIYEINISFSSKNDTNLGNIVHSIVFSFFIAEMNSKSCENDDYLIFSNKISEFLSLDVSKELKIKDYYLLFKNRCKAFKKLEYYHDVPFENSIINYYEFFISKVDQITKNKHGLFYTPISVVTFILKGIDYILREEFNEKYGLCPIKKDKFMLLDPAMGPGIFIFQYIDFLEKIFSHKPNLKLNKLEFYKNLFNSISGIELLPESYIIFKLLLDTKLVKKGIPSSINNSNFMFIQSDTLSKEIKTNYSAINNSNIIFGNPPYSGHSKNRNYWIDTLLKDKSSYYEINGIPISEKTSKWIQDDYVKFIKFAHSLVEQKGYGIIAFITNHGFIDNPTFRAMRYQLLQFFTNIYILNLHGYYLNNKHDGIKDENIFDIKKGVSINIFVKKQNQKSCEFIHYYEIFGDREKKLDFLQKKSLKTINWSIIKPTPENYFFHKIDQEIYLEYLAGWKIISKNPKDNVIFNKNSVGLLSAQDKVVIQFDKKSLKELLVDFSSKSIEELKSKYPDIEDNSCWKLESAIKDVKDSGEFDKRIKKILYRPFDVRYTYYSGHSTGFLCRPRILMKNMVDISGNLGLIVARTNKSNEMDHFFITEFISEAKTAESTTQSYIIPTFVKIGETLSLNFSNDFISYFEKNTGFKFVEEAHGDLVSIVGYKDILGYIYSLFYSNSYRERYKPYLKTDFPRICFVKDKLIFKNLSIYGNTLINLHLMKTDDKPLQPAYNIVLRNNNCIPANIKLKWKEDKLFLNSENFIENVSKNMYDFKIGGHNVIGKWLKSRKGRIINVKELDLVLISINNSIKLIKEINNYFESLGNIKKVFVNK